ncbi:MAG: hypothetical protein IJS69_03220 [Selenomonadaceae bacterium]|nr:hypothetical protein [Selenomonadaceae bacterium]
MNSLRKNFFYAALFFVSVLFLYFGSVSTSPRYNFWGIDSAIFQVVGKGWAEGLLPYVNNFENKGPLLFAIDALGYMIYPRVGIFLLQIPFMYFSLLFMWRAVELYWSRRATLIIFAVMIFWRFSLVSEGNRTEEYSMPFLLAATYFFLRELKNFDAKNFCPPLVGFVYGLGFGACVLLRTTNALPICCYVFLSMIWLIQSGAFKNLWRNVLSFCAGFAIICLPFVIYFQWHGILYDALYGTILFSTKMTTTYTDNSTEHFEYMFGYFFVYFVPLYLTIFVSACLLSQERKNKLAWSGIFIGFAMIVLFVKLRPILNYLELIAAVLPIFFAVLYEWRRDMLPEIKNSWHSRGFTIKRLLWKFVAVVTSLYLIFQSAVLLDKIYTNNFSDEHEHFQKKMVEVRKLGALIPQSEKNSVVFWGEGSVVSPFILETGIFPRCRFFCNITNAFGLYDPAVITEWVQNVRSDYPKWIIYSALEEEYTSEHIDYWSYNFRRQRHPAVEKILTEKYIFVDSMIMYGQLVKLYRLREDH